MAQEVMPEGAISLECVCGEELLVEPGHLGRVVRCEHCKRYLRAALQFLLVDKARAPNLAAQCTCGHFLVESTEMSGEQVRCKVCKSYLIMPQPIVKFGVESCVRVPRKVLQNQLKRFERRSERATKEMTRLESAAHAGRITLRPGEHICRDNSCGSLLPAGANVCSKCGTNFVTGSRYKSPGPARDPRGKWRRP